MLLGKGGGSGGGSDSGSGSRLHVAACQPRRHLPCATEQHPRPNKAPGGSCQSSRHQARHVPAPLPGCREFAEETLGLFGGCGVDAAAVATSASAMAQQLRRADRCLLVVHPLRRGSYHMWVAAPGVSRTRAPGTPMPTTYQGAPAAKRGTHRADPPPPPSPAPASRRYAAATTFIDPVLFRMAAEQHAARRKQLEGSSEKQEFAW